MPVGKDKVRVTWPINIETEGMFREFVLKKYGIYANGLLGYELNKIILAAIRKSSGKTAAHTHIKNMHIHSRIKLERTADEREAMTKIKATEFRDKVVKYLVDRLKIEEQPRMKVGLAKLRDAICGVTGIKDHRSIASYMTLLSSSGLISQPDLEFRIYEIITGYQIDLDSKSMEELR